MTLKPAPVSTGIVFKRVDLEKSPAIKATFDHVVDTKLCTCIGGDAGVSVSTIEHLMAAFAAQEIDNCFVEIDGPEVPAMDGSAAPFIFLIERAGIYQQKSHRKAIRILKNIQIDDRVSLTALDQKQWVWKLNAVLNMPLP